jgi:tetratricopeptide (TPR) repeat protein
MMRAPRATLPPISSTTLEGLYATGYWLFMQQRVLQALNVFRAMIHLSPYDERGWLALGTCYEAQDQADVALHVYASSFRMLAAAPRCHLARARILRAQGRSRDAQRALVEAARAAPGSPDPEIRDLIAAEWDVLARTVHERLTGGASATDTSRVDRATHGAGTLVRARPPPPKAP